MNYSLTIKIKQILAIIENKISSLEMQKNSEYKSTSYYQRQKIMLMLIRAAEHMVLA